MNVIRRLVVFYLLSSSQLDFGLVSGSQVVMYMIILVITKQYEVSHMNTRNKKNQTTHVQITKAPQLHINGCPSVCPSLCVRKQTKRIKCK